jgi:2-(1,2-epoxy-1,2-dihydrophenyl)acetyl-CoA isomerase
MEFITYSLIGSVAVISLNRPEKYNSFNRSMSLSLQEALDKAANEKACRAILLRAEGKAFCAGQDLAEALDPNGPGIERIVEEHYNQIILRMRHIEKPIVVAVNGVAAGAGANIALAGDVVMAGKSSAFLQAFSKIGLIPDSGGTFYLPRLIGFGKASALMMLGDKISGEEAEKMGMIYRACEDEKLNDEAMAVAQQLAELPTVAIGLTKKLLNTSMTNNIEQQLREEGKVQVIAANSKDHKEGIKAFLEKRKPVFTGE